MADVERAGPVLADRVFPIVARQHGVERVVALKVLPESFEGDDRGRERFLAEARGLGRIRHPHVVTIHDVIETSDLVAYAMERVDGRSLASLLEELGTLIGAQFSGLQALQNTVGDTVTPFLANQLDEHVRYVQGLSRTNAAYGLLFAVIIWLVGVSALED